MWAGWLHGCGGKSWGHNQIDKKGNNRDKVHANRRKATAKRFAPGSRWKACCGRERGGKAMISRVRVPHLHSTDHRGTKRGADWKFERDGGVLQSQIKSSVDDLNA